MAGVTRWGCIGASRHAVGCSDRADQQPAAVNSRQAFLGRRRIRSTTRRLHAAQIQRSQRQLWQMTRQDASRRPANYTSNAAPYRRNRRTQRSDGEASRNAGSCKRLRRISAFKILHAVSFPADKTRRGRGGEYSPNAARCQTAKTDRCCLTAGHTPRPNTGSSLPRIPLPRRRIRPDQLGPRSRLR